ncbi:hypothetical protein [Amycolatopsis sp. NPDC059021]|uniref:hypothetical protein n=1 Tax=Amycolatopsis sp. NPDC059021 TaxID=3346704 RepID=UPI003670074F
MYAVSILIHLGIAAAAVAALSTTTVVANGLVAFGAGAAAPVIVKKMARYAESLVPVRGGKPQPPQDGGGHEDS